MCRDGVAPAEASASLPASPAATAVLGKKKGGGPVKNDRVLLVPTRIMRELKRSRYLDSIFTVELVNDNLFEWHVKLHKVDPESDLANDMRELHILQILLSIIFPKNFPFTPPFMHILEPRIEKGFVMEGGAICMELLTPRGWASAYTIDAVLMQFAASLVKGQRRVVRTAPQKSREFSRRRAEEAFRFIVQTHDKYGWFTPSLSE